MNRLTHRSGPECTYFVTTKTWENRELFHVEANAKIVVACLFDYRDRDEYLLREFVVMPNHLHILLTPGEKCSLERAMQLIKGGSSHAIHSSRGQKMQIWQPGFHDWTIRNDEDYRAKRQYIWQNPVDRKLVERANDWIFGSACGRYRLDPMPERLASGAKAQRMKAG